MFKSLMGFGEYSLTQHHPTKTSIRCELHFRTDFSRTSIALDFYVVPSLFPRAGSSRMVPSLSCSPQSPKQIPWGTIRRGQWFCLAQIILAPCGFPPLHIVIVKLWRSKKLSKLYRLALQWWAPTLVEKTNILPDKLWKMQSIRNNHIYIHCRKGWVYTTYWSSYISGICIYLIWKLS